MQENFWQDRWENNQIGFHQQDINSFLQKHFSELDLEDGNEIFVPLCGKSLDMFWLAEQSLEVLGIEFSEKAVKEFYAENTIDFEVQHDAKLSHFTGDNISLICGDFFNLDKVHLQNCKAVFDRAALIALPEPMRQRYVDKLASHLPSGNRTLVVTMEYPQGMIPGPPFSVSEDEVKRLYSGEFKIELLETVQNKAMGKKLKDASDGTITEKAWLMLKK